jgi:hypothetical protein
MIPAICDTAGLFQLQPFLSRIFSLHKHTKTIHVVSQPRVSGASNDVSRLPCRQPLKFILMDDTHWIPLAQCQKVSGVGSVYVHHFKAIIASHMVSLQHGLVLSAYFTLLGED